MSAKEQKFPQLFHGRPEWPNRDDEHLFWVGLNTKFQFSHHPVKDVPVPAMIEESFFCRPAQVADQLLGVLKDSRGGGSILVTGYRGTGKTSLVNHCLKRWKKVRTGEMDTRQKKTEEVGGAHWGVCSGVKEKVSSASTLENQKEGKQDQREADKDWCDVKQSQVKREVDEMMDEMVDETVCELMRVSGRVREMDVTRILNGVERLTSVVLEAAFLAAKSGRALMFVNGLTATFGEMLGDKGSLVAMIKRTMFSKPPQDVWGKKDEEADFPQTEQTFIMQLESWGETAVKKVIQRGVDTAFLKMRFFQNEKSLNRQDLKQSVWEVMEEKLKQQWQKIEREKGGMMAEVLAGITKNESEFGSRKKGGEENRLLIVRVNMATVASAHDVLLLAFEELKSSLVPYLKDEDKKTAKRRVDDVNLESYLDSEDKEIVKNANRDLNRATGQLRAVRRTEHWSPRVGIDLTGSANESKSDHLGGDGGSDQTFEREALSRYQAILVSIIRSLEEAGLHPVFVFDEVDKLMPVWGLQAEKPGDISREIRNLAGLQKIVAELKYFLSESLSHQIFIAGKDVDDSWAEDQNKGEGIFESIFASNIQVTSIFTLELEPCVTLLPPGIAAGFERRQKDQLSSGERLFFYQVPEDQSQTARQKRALTFYEALAGQLGIAKNSLVFRTALLILPYLAEYEMVQLLLRGYKRNPGRGDKDQFKKWLMAFIWAANEAQSLKTESKDLPKGLGLLPGMKTAEAAETVEKAALDSLIALTPMSERTCRRLRILLEYLTYKGRGIPRKILREFYGMVRPASYVPLDDPGYWKLWREKPAPGKPGGELLVRYVLSFPQHHLQKMNFYASIVEHLDENFNLLRGLNDKGRVSIFHIVDYLLKFYTVGFSHRDLEHAPFMNDREELFPSRQLATLILRIMDGRLWRRKDSRGPEYRMLHHVAHDLGVMFLRYSPEQMELRHTLHDFRVELPPLYKTLEKVDGVSTEMRLAPIHAQMRLARINELCGRHYDARLAYYMVLRWLRQDVGHFAQAGATLQLTRSETLAVFPPHRTNEETPSPVVHASDFCVAFVGYAVETHQALGRLLEEVGELRAAIQHYEEACKLCEPYNQRIYTAASVGKGSAESIELLQTLKERDDAADSKYEDKERLLREVLERNPPMRPLKLEGIPLGYAQVCNNVAIAYSKLWERTSANEYLLKALFHLDALGDEYGLVDQLFFIGQMMVRRRDMAAAALWYRAALKKAAKIRSHASPIRAQQTAAGWQTPPASPTTEALIFAALGDVTYATGGHVFGAEKPDKAIWDFIKSDLMPDIAAADKHKAILEVDDRWEEHFFTRARRSFESDDRDVDARDVYLRQLEARFSRFEQAAARLDQGSRADKMKNEYMLLNAWTTFWRGARVLMHRNLNVLTSLSRDQTHEWGRIGDFRRMGTMLRLIGAMLMELGLRPGDAPSRTLLAWASSMLETTGCEGVLPAANQFYQQFVNGDDLEASEAMELDAWMAELAEYLELGIGAAKTDYQDKAWWKQYARINVNVAANDIQIIFAYIGDRSDLMQSDLSKVEGLEKANCRSPLYRLNGHDGVNDIGTPIAYLRNRLSDTGMPSSNVDIHFKLLAISEKALLSSYLCYRDCIPDYSYAQSCIQLGELYVTAIYKLGLWSKSPRLRSFEMLVEPQKLAAEAVHYMTEYAKRYLIKAVDILKREQEQNRNTFHLMSEAYFNLGDILLIRLLAITGNTAVLPCELFEPFFTLIIKWQFELFATDQKDGKAARDFCPEDLRRQIIGAYQQGLKCVQDEMNDYDSRFRVPAEVYYSNRNVMDPVLHFRICRAVRLRHEGGRYDETPWNIKTIQKEFDEKRREISDLISGYESPQSFDLAKGNDHQPTAAWVKQLKGLLKFANKVRTDRGPLYWDETGSDGKINWKREGKTGGPPTHGRFVFFANQSPP